MMTRQKSWGPGKVSRRKKNTEEVWNNHSSQNMSGGVPKHGGLCPLAREGDEGAKNKRKRNEMTLWIQPIPNDTLKATAAAVSCSAFITHYSSSQDHLYTHYTILSSTVALMQSWKTGFQLSTYTLHIKMHRVATLIGVHSRPEVPLFWVVNNAKHNASKPNYNSEGNIVFFTALHYFDSKSLTT